MKLQPLFIVIPLLLAAPTAVAQAPPATLNYQGRLTDNSPAQTPVSATVPMKFEIFDAAAAGASLWSETPPGGVLVIGGIFNDVLGSTTPLGAGVFAGATSARYLEITLNPGAGNQEILAPRQLITATGYAQRAADSQDSAALGGFAAGSWQRRISACGAGTAINTVNADGTVGCVTASSASLGGTPNTLVKFTGAAAGGNSSVTDDGTTLATSDQVDITGGTGTTYLTAPLEIRTTLTPRLAFHWPGVVSSQLGMDSGGVIRTYNNPGTGYEQFAASNIYSNGFLSVNGASDAAGNLRFSAANPYIVASSYAVIPGGAYFTSGTVYFQAQAQFRGGIHNDSNAYLQLDGGTSGINYFPGQIGIGTAGPGESLQTTGNIRADGSVFWGNQLSRTESRDDAGLNGGRSGFYEGSSPVNFYPGASSWQHLIEARHSNLANNYALQIGGSFFDEDLWFRKTNNVATTGWQQLIGAGSRQCTAPFNSAGVTFNTSNGGIARSNTMCATTWFTAANFNDAQNICFALGGHISTYNELYRLAQVYGAGGVLFNGDWIGQRAGDDTALCVNSQADINNFDGLCDKNTVRIYRCVNGSTLNQ